MSTKTDSTAEPGAITEPTAADLVKEAAELKERGAALTLQARQEAAERRAELERLDAEESARLAQLEAEYGPVIAEKERQARIRAAAERDTAAKKAATAARTAADAAREGLPEDMLALVERFLAWRRLENEYAATEAAAWQAADALAEANGTAAAPVPSAYAGGRPIYDNTRTVSPRHATFTDWSDPLVWLAYAAAAAEPKKSELARGFRVTPR